VKEMLRTFNMGIGMILIINNDEETIKAVNEGLKAAGEEYILIGSVIPLDSSRSKVEGQVYMNNTQSFV